MIVKLVYYEDVTLKNEIESLKDKYKFTFEYYDTKYSLDRRKGFRVKNAFSALLEPFVGVFTDDNKPIKGFYSEAKECTINNIKEYINEVDRFARNGIVV